MIECRVMEVIWRPAKGEAINRNAPPMVAGVYVIFQFLWSVLSVHIVYVGQSKRDVLGRAKDHLIEEVFLNRNYPDDPLYVAWANIEDSKTRNGVERWLGEESRYEPEIGKEYPNDPHIAVNYPVLLNEHGMLLESASKKNRV